VKFSGKLSVLSVLISLVIMLFNENCLKSTEDNMSKRIVLNIMS